MTKKLVSLCFLLAFLLFLGVISASATERLCDASFEDCRAPMLTLIQNENEEIDTAFWYLNDQQIYAALLKKFKSGVPVRILMDPRSDQGHAVNIQFLADLVSDGFPMRHRIAPGILHWKMMLFSGQGVVEFSGANYDRSEMLPYVPYVNYTDEAIYYSDDPAVVNSFRTEYDNSWVDTVNYLNYANINAPLVRAYPTYPIDPEMDFLPTTIAAQNYGTRTRAAMAAEKVELDIDMFRITDSSITSATIAAFNRGVPVRLIVDSSEYRNLIRVWDSYNVDRMFMAGIPVKITEHQGQNHEKAILLYGQGMTIWGSSNWDSSSFNSQQEHDYFTLKPWFFNWFQNQFERRWNSDTEYKAFVPLPPGQATIKSPVSGAINEPTAVTLTWEGGPWGQLYDVFFGTTGTPPLIAQNVVTGAPEPPSGPLTYETYKVSGLAPATKYYWKVVTKTMALLSVTSQTWNFTTGTPVTGTGATVTTVSPTTGSSAGGNTVTITGTNFATGAIVSFGQSTATSAKIVSTTTITAVAPPHVGGAVGVTVTNTAGDTGTLPNAYTYISTTSTTSSAPKLNVIQPMTGSPSGGDAVVISGSNLVKGMTVTIGGTPATITSSSSVSIKATTPAGNGVADVVVTNPNGLRATLIGAFTFTNPPGPPSVTSTSPTSGSIYGGNTITVNGTGFLKGAVVSVGGIRCTTIIVLNSSTITATAPVHALGVADVVVTNMGGESSTLAGGYTYIVAPPPSISAVVPNTGSISGGSEITINGSNFVFGAKVLVGGSLATVQTTTGSYIYATVPTASQAGTVNVVVINPDGQSSTPGTFTYQ